MKSNRFLAILLTLALLSTAVLMPLSGLADTGPQFAGSWYAVSFVFNDIEWFPETWAQDLVVTLDADGHFSWGGKFYDAYEGTWSTLSDTEIQLVPDNDDGTPDAEYAFSLNLNQDGCFVYVEEEGPTVIFADHPPEKPARPEIIREESADKYSGEWILERIVFSDFFVTPEQFAVITGTEISSSIVLDGLDAYIALITNLSDGFTQQLKMKCENGSLVQAQNNNGIYLRNVSMTDIGMLAVELCPDGSGEEPLMFYYSKAE